MGSCEFSNFCCSLFIGILISLLITFCGVSLGYVAYKIHIKIKFKKMIRRGRKEALIFIYHGRDALLAEVVIERFIDKVKILNDDAERGKLEKEIKDGKWDILFGSRWDHYC